VAAATPFGETPARDKSVLAIPALRSLSPPGDGTLNGGVVAIRLTAATDDPTRTPSAFNGANEVRAHDRNPSASVCVLRRRTYAVPRTSRRLP
jgi:hypothetical protein